MALELEEVVLLDPKLVMEESIDAFDELFESQGTEVSWAKHPPTPGTDRFIELVLARSANPVILDCGCGTGVKTCYMASKSDQLKVIGCDPNENALDMARELARTLHLEDRVEFFKSKVLDLNSEELGMFDGIHEYQAGLTHAPRIFHKDIMSVYSNLLQTKGLLLVNGFHRQTTDFWGNDMSQRRNGGLRQRYSPTGRALYCYFYKLEDIRGLLNGSFEQIDLDSIKEFPHPTQPEGRTLWEALLRKK